ncbi:hypothetical protein HHI36_003809 [Cryptolaemus montrouzieri]|uniref:Uncharacterized protein n=1 Tax=Cryptolaemus montrouzieri TaxID=559131 RepID=A0ABD2NPE8_9CUCU
MASDALGTVEILALMTRVRNDHIITTEKAEFFEEKLDAVFKELNLTFRETVRKLTHDFIDIAGVTTITPEWKFMVVSFYCLHLLDREMRKDELLSVAQTKVLKNYVAAMIDIGILQNLIPTLPHFKLLRTNKLGIQCQYYMLKASVCGLFKYAMLPTLRYHLLHNFMAGSLVALIQLSYCPVKKPLSNIEDEFIMSEEFYGELLGDQDRFQGFITIIQNTVSPMSLMRDAMLLFTTDTPLWFRKGVSRILTNGIKRKDGLLNVMSTIIHVDPKNTTIALKKVQAISQIVVILCTNGDNKDYMYPQIDNLLTFALTSSENMLTILEHLYATIVISLYPVQKAQAELFVDKLLSPLKKLSNETDSEEQKTFFGKEEVMQIIRVTFYIFLDTKNISMPLKLLEPYISILFNIYSCIPDSESIKIKSDLHDIIIHFMKTSERPMVNLLLENFLFNFKIPEVLSFREDIIIRVDASMVQIDFSEKRTKHEVVKNAHKIYNLCKSEVTLFYRYFGFY